MNGLLEWDPDALFLQVTLERGPAVVAADAGLLVATKRHRRIKETVGVDPAGPQRFAKWGR